MRQTVRTEVLAELSDKELLESYQAGDFKAIQSLVMRHRQRIYTSIYMLVKDRHIAEDIFQDTVLKVMETLKQERYTESGKFLPWAMRIAHNLSIDHFRRGKKMPTITTEDGTDVFSYLRFTDEKTAEDRMMETQSHSKIRDLIQALPEEQREVVVMRMYGDMSFKEIAAMTDVSINTALGRMRYALNNLRKLIRQNQIAL